MTVDRASLSQLDAAEAPALRLHIGCGPKVLPGWVNMDRTARAEGVITDIDLTALPFDDGTVDEILAEHVFEHFTFHEEGRVWSECVRVLRAGGTMTIEVPDFEWACQTFLAAIDCWRDFYLVGHADHYAGCGRALDQRWGILQTMFFGNQNGAGQFHHSAYTEGKLRAIADRLGFGTASVARLFNKGGQALRCVLIR